MIEEAISEGRMPWLGPWKRRGIRRRWSRPFLAWDGRGGFIRAWYKR